MTKRDELKKLISDHGFVIEKTGFDKDGIEFWLASNDENSTTFIFRNQIHTPDDFFVINLYTYEEAQKKFEQIING